MLAKILIAERQRITAKVSLFWRKTFNPTFDIVFSPTIFNLENIASDARLIFHDRFLFLALSHNAELVFELVLAFELST